MLLVIDNYDSFTYNLVQMLGELGAEIEVRRNDEITVEHIESSGSYDRIVISPGPGTPAQAGISKRVVERLAGKVPILGVCLGHQAIAEVFGAKVRPSGAPVHGKASSLTHDSAGLFRDLPQGTKVGRYHSLIVEPETVPKELVITATSPDGTVMGIRHREYKLEGVQFHPESVLTAHGREMLRSFLGT